ncbi:MAG: diphosphomevalonate decarboxylase, partial [Bacteroidota bacterium]
MMTSSPYYLLFKPNTIKIIEEVWEFRKQNLVPIAITLDAGANVHLLYPKQDEDFVVSFIRTSLTAYCQNGRYICDNVGDGPHKIEAL